MLSENRNVLKLIGDISTHLDNISDRLLTLENKVESIDNKVASNSQPLKRLQKDISTLNKADNHKDEVVQLDRRVTLVEIKLSEQGNSPCLHVNNNTQQTIIRTKCGGLLLLRMLLWFLISRINRRMQNI